MFIKRFTAEFDGQARTLPKEAVTTKDVESGVHTRLHSSGWMIKGEIHWFVWVNKFEAVHSKYGRVWGDFEHKVYADSENGYKHFLQHHPPDEWDYGDI